MRRINPSGVLATLALFVSLGGTSLAAAGLIGTNQIKNHAVTANKIAPNAVTTAKVADGSLTSADIAPNTFLAADGTAQNSNQLGGRPASAFVQGTGNTVANRISVLAGQSRVLLSLGFGHIDGVCGAGGHPQLAYVSDTASVNLIDSVTTFGSPHGTADIHTTNGLSNGGSYIESNGTVLPQSVNWQAAFTDGNDTSHVASAWTTGQDIGQVQCIFTGQGITTG
jgi:hypothetical protein